MFATTGEYRGVIVRIKELTYTRKKDITRDTKKEMRLLRELKHDNVNAFIGAVVQPNRLLLISDYCAKGSLYVSSFLKYFTVKKIVREPYWAYK